MAVGFPGKSDVTRLRLKAAGLKATVQRNAILRTIAGSSQPMSAKELCEQKRLKSVDRATVYRIVQSLEATGIIHLAYTSGRTSFYEVADHCSKRSCHPHFICKSCGTVSCLYDSHVPHMTVPKGYAVERSKMLLFGLCPACTTRKA